MTGEDHIVAADYITGELTAAARQSAEQHLSRCAACRAAVEAARMAHASERASQLTATLLNFVGRALTGGAMMLAPSLRLLPGRAAKPEEKVEREAPRFEPLRVLLPRVTTGLGSLTGRFGIVLALTIGVLLLPTPAGLSNEGHRALAVFVFTGGILALEPVSLPIAALMVPVVQVALGVADAPQAFESFSRPVVFLILASLFLAEALRKHGLTRRLAFMTMVASGGRTPKLLLGLMLTAAVFSMWVENTATAAVLIPVALALLFYALAWLNWI